MTQSMSSGGLLNHLPIIKEERNGVEPEQADLVKMVEAKSQQLELSKSLRNHQHKMALEFVSWS